LASSGRQGHQGSHRDLWSAVLLAAASQPTQTMALVVSGMNDVINAQGELLLFVLPFVIAVAFF
jgi:hypothetical protein